MALRKSNETSNTAARASPVVSPAPLAITRVGFVAAAWTQNAPTTRNTMPSNEAPRSRIAGFYTREGTGDGTKKNAWTGWPFLPVNMLLAVRRAARSLSACVGSFDEPVLLHAIAKRVARDSEEPGGSTLVATRLLQRPDEQGAFHRFERETAVWEVDQHLARRTHPDRTFGRHRAG